MTPLRLGPTIALGTALTLFVSGAFAQTTQGVITGRVVDSVSGASVAGARVRCFPPDGFAPSETVTASPGFFLLPLLSPGHYRLRVEATGYQPAEVHQVDLAVAGRLEFELRLRPLADIWQSGRFRSVFLPQSEAILTFYGPDIDTSRSASFQPPRAGRGALESSISQVIDPRQIRDLPLAGRDLYTSLILQPGVVGGTANARGLGLAISGQRPTSSNFLLDGVESNNYLTSGPLTSPAPEMIQEYRISTNNFSAEYGRTAGVLANAVTRAGGNRWSGQIWYYAKNTALNANDLQRNRQALERAPLHESQPGFQVGGPLLRDRLFVSGSAEWLRSRGYGDPVSITLPSTEFLNQVASLRSRNPAVAAIAALLDAHPFAAPLSKEPIAEVQTALPNFADRWLSLARIDYSPAGGSHRIMGRFSHSRLNRPQFLWSPYQGLDAPLDQEISSLAASITTRITPSLTNDGRVGFTADSIGWDRPHPEISRFRSDDGALLPGSEAFYSYRNRSRTTELADGMIWSRGGHLVQWGGGVLLRRISGYLTAGRDGQYGFNSVFEFARGEPNSYTGAFDRAVLPHYSQPDYAREWSLTQFHLYAQDTFRATPRLSLNYGVRYENFGAPAGTGGAPDTVFQAGSGPTLDAQVAAGSLHFQSAGQGLYRADNRNWAARLGASYDLTGTGRLLLRGAWGIFYDRPFENLWANVRLNGIRETTFTVPPGVSGFLDGPSLARYTNPVALRDHLLLTWIDPGLASPRVQSFFGGLQSRLTDSLSLEGNGTGSQGRHLVTSDRLNRGSAQIAALPEIQYRAGQGASSYAALQMLARYRSSIMQTQVAYTWSHSIDTQSSPIAGDFFDLNLLNLTGGQVRQPYASFTLEQQPNLDRGSSDFDQRHNVTVSAMVTAPRGRSRWNWATAGWSGSALASFRSGFPFSVYSESSVLGIANQRADLLDPRNIFRSDAADGGRWLLNRAAFASPASGAGTLGRNALGGPGLYNIDASINRSFHLRGFRESVRFVLRADAFNLLNHSNLGAPDPYLGSSTFGYAAFGRKAAATGFAGLLPLNETARQVQVMLRLQW